MGGATDRQRRNRSEKGFANWKNNKKRGVKKYYSKHPESRKRIQKKSKSLDRLIKKLVVLEFYSGGTFLCSMCGESRIDCLSIDHIYGGGTKHKKNLRKAGIEFYTWLYKNNFPHGFRVLCMNCQFCESRINNVVKQEEYYHTNR